MAKSCHRGILQCISSLKRTKNYSPLCISSRAYAGVKSVQDEKIPQIFDRKTKRIQKDFFSSLSGDSDVYEYVKNGIAYQIADRIADVSREFPLALDLGCGRGFVSRHLTKEDTVETIIQSDISKTSVENCHPSEITTMSLVVDEEQVPLRQNVFDLVTSSLSLHWVNDLPGCFKQVLRVLKPDGCFIGAVFGGDTLFELRCSIQLAEMEREGGMAPHISPFIQGHELANLLIRSGFNLVTVDADQIIVNYPSMFEVMCDVQGMAENSCLHKRKPLHRDTIIAASSIYKAMYANDDNTVPATYQIFYLIGWKPDKSQPKPLERGSTPKGFNVPKGEKK